MIKWNGLLVFIVLEWFDAGIHPDISRAAWVARDHEGHLIKAAAQEFPMSDPTDGGRCGLLRCIELAVGESFNWNLKPLL